jgi:hypothetical protein
LRQEFVTRAEQDRGPDGRNRVDHPFLARLIAQEMTFESVAESVNIHLGGVNMTAHEAKIDGPF